MTDQETDSFYRELLSILRQLHQAADFDSVLPDLEPKILGMTGADRLTIYQRNPQTGDLSSRFKTGSDKLRIRVPVSTASLAGYVALTGKSLNIEDVRNQEALTAIHPQLCFDDRFQKATGFHSQAMLICPIFSGRILLGVFQLMRGSGQDPFSNDVQLKAEKLAELIGQKFKYDLGCTSSPYEGLIKQGLLNQKQLDLLTAQVTADISLSRLLLSVPNITKEDVGRSLELFYQVPFVTYYPIDYQLHPVCDRVNAAFLKNNNLVFLSFRGEERITVLIDDPSDTSRVMLVENFLGSKEISFCVGLLDDIRQYLGEDASSAGSGNLNKILGELVSDQAEPEELEDNESLELSEEDSKIVTLVNEILTKGARLNASDIHIEPGQGRAATTIRMRVDGICQEMGNIPASYASAVVSRLKIMSRLDIAERRMPQDGKLKARLRGKPLEARVATVPTVNGEAVVLRLLQSGGPLAFDELNLSADNVDGVHSILKHPHGLFLVVGPTGSGKTTTLHSCLAQLNSTERKIWTAEDPVEITQPGLQQVQVQPGIGLTFSAALRAFLRADPDVVLIGEMRDRETAHTAIEASLTGHMVLSTLHTNSAPETLTRLLDLGIDPVSFADALLGVLAQRLVRTLCPACKESYTPTAEEVDFLKRQYGESCWHELGATEPLSLCRPSGCHQCNETGYKGRIGIHELLVSNGPMRELIYNKAPLSKIKQQASQNGMRTLLQDGVKKVVEGRIDLQQLHKVTI